MANRILVVSQHYWPENFRVTDLCAGFLEAGAEVDVLCGIPNYPKGEWFAGYSYTHPRREVHDGVTLFRCGEIRRKGNTGARIFLNYVFYPAAAWFSLPRLHKRRYDAVFCYNTSPVLMMMPAVSLAKRRHIPLTTYVLDLWPENLYSVLPVKSAFWRRVAAGVSHGLYRKSDRLAAMSPALAEKLRAVAPGRPVAVVPQYCEEFYLQPPDAALLAQLKARFAGRCNVLFAGNFSPAQDLTLLVRLAQKLRAAGRTDIHFVMAGDGMSRAALEAGIDAAGVRDFFTFEGQRPVTEIPAYQAMADILFAALAKSDDLGLTVPAKITSYLAAGKPLLVAIDGEGARVVREAGAGLACGAGDADALYDNLLRLADGGAAMRAAMGARGRAWCEAHYERKALVQKLLHCILDTPEDD